jgi:hypothetical protein
MTQKDSRLMKSLSRVNEESSDRLLAGRFCSQAPLLKTTEEADAQAQAGEKWLKPSESSYFSIFSSPYIRLAKDITLFLLAFFGIFAILSQLAASHDRVAQDQVLKGCDCGASVAEAVSKGCKFDSLATSWLPDHCRDDELTSEFETLGDGPNGTWIYYADMDHTIELNRQQVGALADNTSSKVYLGVTYHKLHCVFYWRKQYRAKAKLNEKIVEPMLDNEGHIEHCGEVLLRKGYSSSSPVLLNTNSRAEMVL